MSTKYRVKRFNANNEVLKDIVIGSSALGAAALGAGLGRKYRYHKARSEAESNYDPKRAARYYGLLSTAAKLDAEIDRDHADEYDRMSESYAAKSQDIKSNPEKYRKEEGNRSVQSVKNAIHNGTADRLTKHEIIGAAALASPILIADAVRRIRRDI